MKEINVRRIDIGNVSAVESEKLFPISPEIKKIIGETVAHTDVKPDWSSLFISLDSGDSLAITAFPNSIPRPYLFKNVNYFGFHTAFPGDGIKINYSPNKWHPSGYSYVWHPQEILDSLIGKKITLIVSYALGLIIAFDKIDMAFYSMLDLDGGHAFLIWHWE